MSTLAARIRVLALSPIPEEGAGCRFRIAQFVPYLSSVAIDVTVDSLFTPDFFRLVYRRGRYVRKAFGFARLALKRLAVLQDAGAFDAILLYRELFPIGPAILERRLGRPGRPPIVFDFDDAIFLPSVSEANRSIAVLKQPGKVATIVERAAHVIAGNDYLARYARRYNDAVTTIPTSVDTTKFRPAMSDGGLTASPFPIVGWIGSPTTAVYIRNLLPVLRRVAERRRFVLRVSGAGESFDVPKLSIENVPWTLNREVELFSGCDVGVYPLADDDWSKGKCGFKAIAFMACGVPVVAAAVGVNREIIRDGVNGFLASSETEWVDKIEQLLSDPALRRRFGEAARKTVEQRYSVGVNGPKLADVLRSVVQRSLEEVVV